MAAPHWTHKVVKVARGIDGQWFDHPTAATFATEAEALDYAEAFAREQGQAGIYSTRITVRTRKGNRTIKSFKTDDYAPSNHDVRI